MPLGVAIHDAPFWALIRNHYGNTTETQRVLDNRRGSLPPITNPDEPLQLDSLGLGTLGRIFGR